MGTVYGSSRELGSECRGLAPVQRQHRGTTRSVACGSRIQLKMSVLFCCAATARVSGGEAEPSRARQVVRAWVSRGGLCQACGNSPYWPVCCPRSSESDRHLLLLDLNCLTNLALLRPQILLSRR